MLNEEINAVNESMAESCRRLQSQYQQLQKTLEKCSDLSARLLSDYNKIGNANFIRNIANNKSSVGNTFNTNLGPFSKMAGMMSSFFNNARASGGNVSQSVPYLVGERGPEIFVPGNSGKIIPNQGTVSAKAVNIVMNINTPDSANFQKSKNQIISELARAIHGAKNL
ncbi:MAG: hypothetical protein KBC27_02760 [Rickettsiales bacterium]|nr:hypothetical protein [Rickettsiales bacterium]